MIMLIKSGAFDSLYDNKREKIMEQYLSLIADKKKRITLQNMKMLIDKDMIPAELEFEKKLFNFNKYLKKFKDGDYFNLDSIAMRFYFNNYDESKLVNMEINGEEQSAKINQNVWDNIYQKGMDSVRLWMKQNQQQILDELNYKLYLEVKEKYGAGTVSSWEMESLGFYYHEHELNKLKTEVYNISSYSKLPEEPVIERSFITKDGSEIKMMKISRIAGTVIDKDKNKSQIALLTTDGVVVVKIWKNQYASWDKQIAERDNDGVKHVVEKSWFTKGTKLIITGIRRGDNFIPKKYKSTEYPLFEKIIKMDDNGFILEKVEERIEVNE